MKYYLVDFENVNTHGLNGIEKLTSSDAVYIFYSENAASISIEHHFAIERSEAKVEFQKVDVSGKNSLDFQLVSFLGYLICENKCAESEFVLVTKDCGYSSVLSYWQPKGINISVSSSIFAPDDSEESETNEALAELEEADSIAQDIKEIYSCDNTLDTLSVVEKCISNNNCRNGIHRDMMKELAGLLGQKRVTEIYKFIQPIIKDYPGAEPKPESCDSREAAIICEYDKTFKTAEYKTYRKEALDILINGKRRSVINNKLTKYFSGSQVKKLNKHFKPFNKDLPG